MLLWHYSICYIRKGLSINDVTQFITIFDNPSYYRHNFLVRLKICDPFPCTPKIMRSFMNNPLRIYSAT